MTEKFQNLYSVPGNEVCADCNAKKPQSVVFPYLILVCRKCAGIHRADTRVKDLDHDNIPNDTIDEILKNGNKKSNDSYLKYLPIFYRLPDENGPEILRKEFIIAKYRKKEFYSLEAERNYLTNIKIGLLRKRCKDKNRYNDRYFRMSVNEISFNYFVKDSDVRNYDRSMKLEPKRNLRLDRINATIIATKDPKSGHEEELLMISFFRQEEGSWRHIYLNSTSNETLVEWYQAIRFAKFSLRAAYVTGTGEETNEKELVRDLTLDISFSGWLQKTGPSFTEPWQRRWCVLLGRRLLYSTEPLSPSGKGEIVIGEKNFSYGAKLGLPEGTKKRSLPPDHVPLTIITPARNYLFTAESQVLAEKWRDLINNLAEKDMSIREMADYQLHPKSNPRK